MKQRLLSLDVFRGMTIFFMIVVNTPGSWNYVYAPLLHAKWNGCTPTDLVFPFFMFIVGISMAISYKPTETSKNEWVKRSLSRGLKIILIGLLLNWFPFFTNPLQELRIYGVLQRIGLAFLIAGVLVAYIKPKYIWGLIAVLLLGYWGILLTAGSEGLTLEGNLVRTLDLYLFGENHVYKGYGIPFDPEGLLSTIPSVGTVLLGYLTGLRISDKSFDVQDKVNWLLKIGVLLVVVGLIWSFVGFPINKPIWSSSYVLYTAGLGMIVFAFLIWLIDMNHIKNWTYVFQAFGKNPLVTYIMSGVLVKTSLLIHVGDMNLYQWLYVNIYQLVFGNYLGSLLFALSVVMLIWVIAWWMDRRGIIVKV